MTNLALKSVLHGWRRYLPVVLAVGVSGLMMVAQVALAMGAFSLAAAPIRLSTADLWIGPTDAKALEESQGLSTLSVGRLWMDPDIVKIEAYGNSPTVSIGENEDAGAYGTVSALQNNENSMRFARAVTPKIRQELAQPGTIALDRADARKLGVKVGDRLKVNRTSVRIVALLDNVKVLFGMHLLAMEMTASDLLQGEGNGDKASFYLVGLRPGADPAAVVQRLTDVVPPPEYRVWTSQELSASAVRYWALGSGAGTLFLASSSIALVITLMVVSQTLGAAIAGAMREYAALRAYGIGFRAVQWVVMKQGFYVCAAALALTVVASALLLVVLRNLGVSVALPLPLGAGVGAGLALTVIVSNLFALRRLRRADPASLLK